MPRLSLAVSQPDGLHARPAAQFVKLAGGFRSSVKIRRDGHVANGKSILSVLGLGVSRGTEVELDVEGEDQNVALSQLSEFLRSGGAQ
jgi:phosphocarrier protein